MTVQNEITKEFFTGSVSGAGIALASTSAPGQLIHTATAVADYVDEIWLWVVNNDLADRIVTVQWGSAAPADSTVQIAFTVANHDGPKCIIPGWVLKDGLPLYAFCSTASLAMTVHGFVNRLHKVVS